MILETTRGVNGENNDAFLKDHCYIAKEKIFVHQAGSYDIL